MVNRAAQYMMCALETDEKGKVVPWKIKAMKKAALRWTMPLVDGKGRS